MSSMQVLAVLFAVTLLAASGFALWKGDGPERTGAVALLMAWVTTIAVLQTTGRTGHLPIAAIDAALLIALAVLAVRSERSWPVWAAGFHLLSMTSHLAFLLGFTALPHAYRLALLAASFGVTLSLAVGTFWVWQEREALRPLE